ncbi:MAG: hemolysin family protein [Labrys sp. (in: a-proteobacteria)]
MSDSSDRSSQNHGPNEGHAGESFLDRIKIALGLKAPASIREDLADALENTGGSEDSGFSPEERAMLKNILSLREKRVDDVMVPRADIVAVPIDISLADLLKTFQTAGHSRLPVHGETLDDPRGMVHIRDFIAWLASRAAIASGKSKRAKTSGAFALGDIDLTQSLNSVKSLIRSVLFVPPSMPAMDLLAKMQTSRTQLALVIDEYGGTDGLVSMEDIVEIVIGDIEDEHDDDDAPAVVAVGPGVFAADARAELEEVAATIGVDLTTEEDAADVDTLAGWLVTIAGRVPVRGEIVQGPGAIEFEIIDADPRRVKRVRIHTSGDSRLHATAPRRRKTGDAETEAAPAGSATSEEASPDTAAASEKPS